MVELLAAREAATAGDLVELRVDGVTNLDLGRALDGRRVPAIVTCRAMWEGGHFEGTEEERRAVLARALELGAEFVDVEWKAVEGQLTGVSFRDLVHRAPERIVVSSHDFDGVPSDLESRAREMRATGAGTSRAKARELHKEFRRTSKQPPKDEVERHRASRERRRRDRQMEENQT